MDRDDAQFAHDRHGTEVAGVIAAIANNRQGIVGVAPESRLAVFKACWQTAGAGGSRCNSYTLAQALAAGIADGAPIINLSLGGPPDELLGRLVALAVQRGRIVIGAVPPDGNLHGFPVGVPGVIAVESNGGLPAQGHLLQAPGRDILTLQPGGRYDFGSGSSLAAAHVSAAAALLLSAEPHLDAARVRSLLEGPLRTASDPERWWSRPRRCSARASRSPPGRPDPGRCSDAAARNSRPRWPGFRGASSWRP